MSFANFQLIFGRFQEASLKPGVKPDKGCGGTNLGPEGIAVLN